MPYLTTVGAILGTGKSGLAPLLRAQVVDNNGNAISTPQGGFIERGTSGSYMITVTLPDAHRGGIDIYSTSAPATILAFLAVNPDELEYVVEPGYTYRQILRLVAAALLGKVSGVNGAAPVFRDVLDTKNRITATTTPDGRATVTLDAS